jgi:hypothetical protein
MSDYQTLARQVIATLRPGDYLEILIATSSKTQIRVAQFIKSSDAQELSNITTLIKKISCPILSDVDVSKSVDFALKRLIKSDAKNSFAYASIMLFSDGRLNDNDVIQLQELSRELKKRNWPLLCVTGTRHSNKKLLLAANQGDLNFSLISDANPVLWIKRNKVEDKPVLPKASVPIDSQPDKAKSKTNPTTTIGVEISVSQGEEQPKDVQPVPTPEDKPQKPIVPSEANDKAGNKPVVETSPQKDRTPSVTKPKIAKKSNTWLWLLPLITILALFAALLVHGISKARQWKSKVGSHLNSTQQKIPCTLTATVNDQKYHLGRIDKIGQIHVGSNPQNSIRICDRAVAARHFKIFRRFNSLWLKNLSLKTAFINGIPLKPAKKARISLPCNIKIDDSITIKLQLQRPVTQSLSRQEDGHADKE